VLVIVWWKSDELDHVRMTTASTLVVTLGRVLGTWMLPSSPQLRMRTIEFRVTRLPTF